MYVFHSALHSGSTNGLNEDVGLSLTWIVFHKKLIEAIAAFSRFTGKRHYSALITVKQLG